MGARGAPRETQGRRGEEERSQNKGKARAQKETSFEEEEAFRQQGMVRGVQEEGKERDATAGQGVSTISKKRAGRPWSGTGMASQTI
jgi:hypothetical protein